MECRHLYFTLNGATDLKDLSHLSKMDLYAVVSIRGDENNNNYPNQQLTLVHKGCGTNPTWNCRMKFTIDVSAADKNRLELVVTIKAKKLLGDKEVGKVCVPIKALLENYNEKSQRETDDRYKVKTPSGREQGELNFSYKFGKKFTTNQAGSLVVPLIYLFLPAC